MEDMLITFNQSLKALGDGRIGGYLVVFGDENNTDLEGDYFTKNTDFDIEDGDPITVYYNHGLDPVLKRRKLGRGTLRIDDAGVWMEAQLQLRDEYERFIYGQVEAGKMGLSSGSLPNLVEREQRGKSAWVKHWPLGKDGSVTPAPMEWRTTVTTLKSLMAALEADNAADDESETEQPEALESVATVTKSATASSTGHTTFITITSNEEVTTMSDTNQAPPAENEEFKALKGQVDKLSENVNQMLEMMQNAPALRDAGYYSDEGGKDDAEMKSFGDFLLAVQRGDTKRLANVYKSYQNGATKDLSTVDGSAGGFLVPQEFSTQLLRAAEEQSPILAGVTTVPVGASSGKYPALDNTVTPTAGVGQTAMAAGVRARARAEGTTPTETEPQFIELDWRIKQVGGYTEVNNELIRWSPAAIDTLLRTLFGISIGARQEQMILRGNGSTEYLGILTSAAAIGVSTVTDNVFAYADMLGMRAQFKKFVKDPIWIAHLGVLPDIGQFEIGTRGVAVPTVGTMGATEIMPGTPHRIVYSEHMPQANGDDVILADLGAYVVFQNGQLEIAFSEHAAFTTNKGTWRFLNYSDGMPWVKGPITLADPTGSYTVSPFVYHND